MLAAVSAAVAEAFELQTALVVSVVRLILAGEELLLFFFTSASASHLASRYCRALPPDLLFLLLGFSLVPSSSSELEIP